MDTSRWRRAVSLSCVPFVISGLVFCVGCGGQQQTASAPGGGATAQPRSPSGPPPAPPTFSRANGAPAAGAPASGVNTGPAWAGDRGPSGTTTAQGGGSGLTADGRVGGGPPSSDGTGANATPAVPSGPPVAGFEVGNLAPEIVGEDLDDDPLQLSDYRGKVVVLDFWGDWCPPCRAMYPHERSLVAAMQGRPFALLGVNSDEKKAVKEAVERESITWSSWWDGGSTGGPIASYYSVSGWPTIYVIDHQGIIRYKNVRGEQLEQAVEELLAKAEVADAAAASEFPIVGDMAPVLRQWTDKSGKFTVKAQFVAFRNGKAHLKKDGDEVIEVAMSKLCDEDQEFIREKLKAGRGSD